MRGAIFPKQVVSVQGELIREHFRSLGLRIVGLGIAKESTDPRLEARLRRLKEEFRAVRS